jgi:conjugal transfer pilus assembly protein TraE
MNLKIWHSKILKLWQERNGYLILAAGLLMTNLIQLVITFGIRGQWHTVIVPANLSETVWLNQGTVSVSYLAEMTHYFAKLILDITPDSAAFQRETLLKYVEPEYYGFIKNQLIANEERIKKEAIATSFYPIDVKVDQKNLTATVVGDLKTFVGQECTTTTRRSYFVKYRYHYGRLLLQQFNEVKKNES